MADFHNFRSNLVEAAVRNLLVVGFVARNLLKRFAGGNRSFAGTFAMAKGRKIAANKGPNFVVEIGFDWESCREAVVDFAGCNRWGFAAQNYWELFEFAEQNFEVEGFEVRNFG